MDEQTCKNCGGWYGLHHYETNQCPKNGRETNPQMWETTTYQEEDKEDTKIADLEAKNILLNNTINVQLQVIREHQAADVIAVEAIRSQAAKITELKAQVKELEDDKEDRAAEKKFYD